MSILIKFKVFIERFNYKIVDFDTENFIITISNSTSTNKFNFNENSKEFINDLGMFILEEEILDKIDYEIDNNIENTTTKQEEENRKKEIFLSLVLNNTVLKTDDTISHSNSIIFVPMLDNKFTIQPNAFLNREIKAYFNTPFHGYGKQNNPDYLNVLKNDTHQNWSDTHLSNAINQLKSTLLADLPQITDIERASFTICVVPRAKADNTYRPNQLLFKTTVRNVVNQLGNNSIDGTDYIERHTNTRTTHLRKPMEGLVNDGLVPYPGISTDTCSFSKNIIGQNILLIDDIYTKTVNIDEDMIQALLNYGANSVTFYAIGNTVYNH